MQAFQSCVCSGQSLVPTRALPFGSSLLFSLALSVLTWTIHFMDAVRIEFHSSITTISRTWVLLALSRRDNEQTRSAIPKDRKVAMRPVAPTNRFRYLSAEHESHGTPYAEGAIVDICHFGLVARSARPSALRRRIHMRLTKTIPFGLFLESLPKNDDKRKENQTQRSEHTVATTLPRPLLTQTTTTTDWVIVRSCRES